MHLFSVGYHNGGLCLKDRNLIESLFLKGDLQILCTTNTLAHGINLPAHTVIIKSTQYLYVKLFSAFINSLSMKITNVSVIDSWLLNFYNLFSNKEKGVYTEYDRSMILQVSHLIILISVSQHFIANVYGLVL